MRVSLSRRQLLALAAAALPARSADPLFAEVPPSSSGIAWTHDNALQFDEKAGRWVFAGDVLQSAMNAGLVHGAALNAPFGGKLSLEELARTEKGFDVDHLARALTRHRMERLARRWFRGRARPASCPSSISRFPFRPRRPCSKRAS